MGGATMPIIQVEGLSFSYGEASRRALDGVSLSVAQGDFLGIAGPSGSGKSTLAAAMCAAVPHHFDGEMRGRVLVGGRDTCEMTLTDAARIVGFVAQDIDAQMVASAVADEMAFGMENFGVPHAAIERRACEALSRVGAQDLMDRDIATLSGGQKQKVAVAAILALRPRVLVLDEPTAALDPASSRDVFELLRSLNEREGTTVVVIEQKAALLAEFCRHVAVMEAGRVALAGEAGEVFSRSDELRRIGVDCPRATRISNGLIAHGLADAGETCLTVREAVVLASRIAGFGEGRGTHVAPAGGARAVRRDEHAAGPVRFERVPSAGHAAPSQVMGGAGPAGAEASASGPMPAGASTPARRVALAAFAAPAAPMPPAAPVIEFDNVGFSYPRGGASVAGLSFSVAAGQFAAIVGANGAGKTTATKLACGLLKPGAGTVRVGGVDTRTARASAIAREVSTLFQNPDRQICGATVRDEVAFGLIVRGEDAERARLRAEEVARSFGLDPDAAPFELSRGRRQMVALASAVACRPRALVLDEPTSGLDCRECMTVMRAVDGLRAQGCAVATVCHDMEVVSDFATHLIVMAEGRVIAEGAPASLFADEALMRAARIAPPQVAQVCAGLAHAGMPQVAGLSEVSDVVRAVEAAAHAGTRNRSCA